MIIIVNLLMTITNVMYIFPQPVNWTADLEIAGVFLFFELEWIVWISTLVSNIFFIALRTCFRNKI